MAENTAKPQELTPVEIKEIQDFLKKKGVDIEIRFSPPKIRRMEDGGLVVDPPVFSTRFVRIKPIEKTNGNTKLDVS